jgi:bifunctional non-homologous end joining protein LigD
MFKAFEFCLPTTGTKVPAGAEWLHEIKYDGFRLRVERDGDRVRLITRGDYDWTKRYPWIVEAALKNRQKQFVLKRFSSDLNLRDSQTVGDNGDFVH